ncbi:hypothetical protein SDC9_165969 [bioreactor metagenome]|uniref:Uncharacterized protein n=1 Tax=bioreactor metagenome TaxID=1076179 RepID=A0A645FYA5_9ZZZZ
MDSGSVGNIIIDRHGKRIGALKYHADPFPEHDDIRVRMINIDVIQEYFPFNPDSVHQIIHAIQCFDKS